MHSVLEKRGRPCHGRENAGGRPGTFTGFLFIERKREGVLPGWVTVTPMYRASVLHQALHGAPSAIRLFNPFANPGAVVTPILQMRGPSPRAGRSLAPGQAGGEWNWHSIPSPGQQGQEPSARGVCCPGPHPTLAHLCVPAPLGPPRQLGTVARASPVPGLATSQPQMPGFGAKAPEPVVPPGAAGHDHQYHSAHSNHMPPPGLVSGLLGPWGKNSPLPNSG